MNGRNPPVGQPRGSKTSRTATGTITPAIADHPPDAGRQLTSDPPAWGAYVAGYAAGFGVGLEQGRKAAENDMARSWATLAQRIRRIANSPTHAELVRSRTG